MANFIVRAFQRRALRKLPDSHSRIYTSLDDAKSVGFVFNSQDTEVADGIILLCKELKNRNIPYKGLGISFTKDETTNTRLDHDPYIVQILKKETNWLYIPVIEQAQKFFEGEYDILFDLSPTPSYSIEYTLKRCKTKMILGISPSRGEMYDIAISGGKDELMTFPPLIEYTKQIIQYLTTIKSK